MAIPPDDTDPPDDPKAPDDDSGGGDEKPPEGPEGPPPGATRRKMRVVISPVAHEVKFADLFGITIAPAHGVIKFGTMQPETGEFVVHTQIAMTPQGMMALSQALQKNLEKARKTKPGDRPRLN